MNYTKQAALLCFTICAILLAISFIPPQSVYGVELRRANILSEIASFPADYYVEEIELVIDDMEYEVDLESVANEVVALEESEPLSQSSYAWHQDDPELLLDTLEQQRAVKPRREVAPLEKLLGGVATTPIENFDTVELNSLRRLYQKLLSPDSLVRIAVMGDSFIEADILTADLRESLQTLFGGCGSGFAPIASPLTQYRQTIKTQHKGWTSHNVMQRTQCPYSSLFSVAGWVNLPAVGATTTWSGTTSRSHLESCECAKIHFVALNDCELEVTINDSEPRTFSIEGGEGLRQIEVAQSGIESLKLRIVSGQNGFVGYGAIFEGKEGVVVDNYSVRSNNGQAMFWTSASINAQIDKAIGGYDMVILQYGLNIMQSGVNNYTRYAEQVEKMVAYAQQCFPSAAIVVMSVSDRSYKIDGTYRPMSEAVRLSEYQRSAAESMGVGFWSTYEAMQAQGGMSSFVSNGWAAKDFTHINFAGGRQVAWALVDAIIEGVEAERSRMIQRVEHEPVLDSLTREKLQKDLFEAALQ